MSGVRRIFWDLGGVLLSNGWDTEQRSRAVAHFGLDAEEFEDRHREVVGALETGRCTLEDYLQATIFHAPRPFNAQEFRAFMREQSHAFEANLAVVGELAARGRYLLATLNNESRELNEHRIERFGLRSRFTCFFTSAFLGVMKPSPEIYRIALEVTQRRPEEALFIDDRAQNLEPARALGLRVIHFRADEGADVLRQRLVDADVELRGREA
jgi:putative hydrolase of the HAD superfamily